MPESVRDGTIAVYTCESCDISGNVYMPDSALDKGTLFPRSLPCQCGSPQLPAAARRCSSQEYAVVTTAVITHDLKIIENYFGNKDGLGILPGVKVATLPYGGDVIIGTAGSQEDERDG